MVSFKVEQREGDEWINAGMVFTGDERDDLECGTLIISERQGVELRLGEAVE